VDGRPKALTGHGWAAYINEEGKLAQNPVAEVWMRFHGCDLPEEEHFAGSVVFVGPFGAEGEITSLPNEIDASLEEWLQRA
jgi:hypothetical protein